MDRGARAATPQVREPRWRRLWDAPVWAHVVALGIVLLALVPVVGTSASLQADEGAAIVQARSLARGGGWIVEHPAPSLDPTGKNYPLELSEQGTAGKAPFGKHPLYALVLAGADLAGGTTAMVLLSLAGLAAAAAVSAALAGRLDPSLRRPALWIVGLGSPLLFDGFLVIAHTLGAAAAAGAVLAAVVALERRRLRIALGVVPLVVVAVLLRNEAVFLAGALATAAAVAALRRKDVRPVAGLVAAGALSAAVVAHFGELWWVRRIVGAATTPVGVAGSAGSDGFVTARLNAFALTWLRPSYGGVRTLVAALVVMLVAAGLTAFAVRRHPDDRRPIVALATVAACAAMLAVAARPTNVVPGLLVAFPLALAGLVLVRRSQLFGQPAQLMFATFAVFALGVLATQYEKGGGGEWGGRYFALGLPVLVPVLLLALRDAGRTLAPTVRRAAAGALAVCTIAMTVMGVAALRHGHQYTASLVRTIDAAGRSAAGLEPVIVTTAPAAPRLSWSTFDDQRWLLTQSAALADLRSRLADAGIDRFVLVTNNLPTDQAGLEGAHVLSRRGAADGSGYQVLVVSED